MLGNLPSFDSKNFSQFKPNDPNNPSGRHSSAASRTIQCTTVVYVSQRYGKMIPITYRPTHDRTLPPPDQVIGQEAKNILIRHFYQHAEEKLRLKRASCDDPAPERASKLPRASSSDTPSSA